MTFLNSTRKVKIILVLLSVLVLSVIAITSLFSCGAGVDVGEADKILTSFSVQWPSGFDYTCITNDPLNVVISALDQYGNVLTVFCKVPEGKEVPKRGDEVVLVDYDPSDNKFEVARMEAE